jgi:archaellum biogenesis ATPase FlaH
MLKGLTYVQAVQKLFELAGVKYSFGEHGVQTKRAYRYPADVVSEDKSQVYKYLGMRKISKETVDYAQVEQDEHGNVVFKYYDLNDVLTMVKYRPSRKVKKGEAKNWCQKDADTAPLLFNMNRINVGQPLLICSGEIDCLSAIEAGFHNAVSIPLGDGNTHWIEENWDWLEEFKDIIICADNDESGRKFQKDIVYRLGSWRCKVVNVPETYTTEEGREIFVKDLNEVLFWYGKEKVLEIILNAKDTPVQSVIGFSKIKKIDYDQIDGICTGIKKLDNVLMRLFYGTFNILTGIRGGGKSSLLSQIICNALDQDKDVWLYSKEMPDFMTKSWLNYILAGPRNVRRYVSKEGADYYKVPDEVSQKIDAHYGDRLVYYKDEWSSLAEDILQSMEDCARKYGCKLFVIDNLKTVKFKCSQEEKWSKQVDFINDLINFAKKYNVVVILVVHPKKIETIRRLTSMDIGGMSDIVDLAHRAISLYRVTPSDKKGQKNSRGTGYVREPIKYNVILDTLKDRMRGKEGEEIGLYYDIPSRRFFTSPEEYDHQNLWDTNNYTTKIEYPIKDDEEEVFGN